MFESRFEPLLPRPLWLARVARSLLLAAGFIAAALTLGVLGYHYLARLAWIDALVDASMILSGMGPVNPLVTKSGKIFASCYALFSGLMFIGASGIVVAPFLHRLMHRLHVEDSAGGDKG